jgi:hypothetical protein
VFSWLSPRRTPEGKASFGFGDRLGLATPGHIRALAGANARERTHRPYLR